MGPFPLMTDDSNRLGLNSGNELSSSSGNGSLLNKTLLGSNDDAKKSKVSKSKKQKSVSFIYSFIRSFRAFILRLFKGTAQRQLSIIVREFEHFISFETSAIVNCIH